METSSGKKKHQSSRKNCGGAQKSAEECRGVWEDGGGQVICPMMSRYMSEFHVVFRKNE